jgi:hypothetical protein
MAKKLIYIIPEWRRVHFSEHPEWSDGECMTGGMPASFVDGGHHYEMVGIDMLEEDPKVGSATGFFLRPDEIPKKRQYDKKSNGLGRK